MGQNVDIKWKTSSDISNMTIYLLQGSGISPNDSYTIGYATSDYNSTIPFEGTFPWKVGYTRDGRTLVPGPDFHINLSGINDKSRFVIGEGEPFTITTCK